MPRFLKIQRSLHILFTDLFLVLMCPRWMFKGRAGPLAVSSILTNSLFRVPVKKHWKPPKKVSSFLASNNSDTPPFWQQSHSWEYLWRVRKGKGGRNGRARAGRTFILSKITSHVKHSFNWVTKYVEVAGFQKFFNEYKRGCRLY